MDKAFSIEFGRLPKQTHTDVYLMLVSYRFFPMCRHACLFMSHPNSALSFPRAFSLLVFCFKHFWNTLVMLQYDFPWLVPTLKSSLSGDTRALSVLNGKVSSEGRQCYTPLSSWTRLTSTECILCRQERDLHWSPAPWSSSAEEALPGHNLLTHLQTSVPLQLPMLQEFSGEPSPCLWRAQRQRKPIR